MGSGIAQVAAVAGYDVTLVDVSPAQLDRARSGIERSLAKLVSKGSVDAEAAEAALARIAPAADDPTRLPSCSVALPTSRASTAIASADRPKVSTGVASAKFALPAAAMSIPARPSSMTSLLVTPISSTHEGRRVARSDAPLSCAGRRRHDRGGR